MYAVPGIIAQTAASLYNMVDSIYIGHIKDVGAAAISGLAVTFPLMNLSVALGTLVGVGSMTMISVMLGQKNYETASRILSNVLSINTIIGLLFTIVSLCFLSPILRFFGASDLTLPYAKDYMTIILIGNVITHLYFGFNGIIRASGNPKTAMGLTLFTVGSNAILDPIFIFTFGMGIQGAALATVICQLMALCYTLKFFFNGKSFLHFPKPLFQINPRLAKSFMSIGMGPFLMNSAACIVSIFINKQLGRYGGDLSIGSYGIINRFTFLFIMIVMGFTQGLQPIAGYNYGARQYSRVKEIFILTTKWTLLITTVCFLISELFPEAAIGLFTSDEELKSIATRGIKIMNASFGLVGFGMTTTVFFQCLGMVKKSIFLSLSRQLLFLVPLLFILPQFMAEKGVWISFPIADFVSSVISFIMIMYLFRKFNKLKDGDDPAILGSYL